MCIIFSIMLVLLVNPFSPPLALIGHLLFTLFLTMIPVASAYALSGDMKKAIIVLIIAMFVGRYMSMQVEQNSESKTREHKINMEAMTINTVRFYRFMRTFFFVKICK